jgi:arylsulfatase A-like enzyme
MYADVDVPLPPNFAQVHPFDNGAMTLRDEKLAAWPRDPEVIRDQIREYYGMISHLDARIGDILDTIDRLDISERTIVIFAGDNGLALGSHGLLGKQSLYEHSTRVPLIVAGAELPHGSNVSFVYLYDLFPTILRFAGVDLPGDIDGIDLAPIWRGERVRVRTELYTAYGSVQRAIRDDRWKLIVYPGLERIQLFDLASDPYETENLEKDLTYSHHHQRLQILLTREHSQSGDPFPLVADTQRSETFDYTSVPREPDRHQPPSVVRKYFSAE